MGSPERRRGFMRNIQIALTKGRLEKHVIPLLSRLELIVPSSKIKVGSLYFKVKIQIFHLF